MRLLAIVLILLVAPVSTLAQARQDLRPGPVRGPAPAFPAEADFAPPSSPGVFYRVLRVVGGAVAGAWVGYMASQVAVSDWDDRALDRSGWAAGGAAVGLAVGLTLPAGRSLDGPPRAVQPGGRDVIPMWELRRAQGGNLYEIVRGLRPEWLRTRGTGSMRETPRGETTGPDPDDVVITQPGIPTIRVYLDDVLMGGVKALRDMQPGHVGEVRFLSPAEATQRWGAGHIHGAIHVITAPAS